MSPDLAAQCSPCKTSQGQASPSPDGPRILPVLGKRNVLITSALPFVNNVPHLGNIIGSVLSCTARELCDKYHAIHADIYKWFNISFDIFGRTTTDLQTKITQGIFLKLQKNGYLNERMTTQLYCEKHSSFLADRFVEGECPHCGDAGARGDQGDSCGQLLEPLQLKNPRCKIDGATPAAKETKHVFLELDKLQPDIEAFFAHSSINGSWSNNSNVITATWLKQGLQPRSITRDIKWGTKVPLPGYEDKVIYSWFDACIGYVSIAASKCAAVIGLAINLVHLLAAVLEPFIPEMVQCINTQLRAENLCIPDRWEANSILPGHVIGKAQHLFSRIAPENAEKWRKMFGSDGTGKK